MVWLMILGGGTGVIGGGSAVLKPASVPPDLASTTAQIATLTSQLDAITARGTANVQIIGTLDERSRQQQALIEALERRLMAALEAAERRGAERDANMLAYIQRVESRGRGAGPMDGDEDLDAPSPRMPAVLRWSE
jgi:hypothetical protein